MSNKASKKYTKINGLILHSDQKWTYQHAYFKNFLLRHEIIQLISKKRNCLDNFLIENFFKKVKHEMFYGYEYRF